MDGVENGRYGYGVGGNMGGLGVWIGSGGCGRKSGYGWECGKWIWIIMGNMAYLFGMGGGGGGVGVGFLGVLCQQSILLILLTNVLFWKWLLLYLPRNVCMTRVPDYRLLKCYQN